MRCHMLRRWRVFASRVAAKGRIVLACLGAVATVLAVLPRCGGRPAAARHTTPRRVTERHDMSEVAPRPPLKKLWESRGTYWSDWVSEAFERSVIVTDDGIYSLLEGIYVATDLRTGKRLWRKASPGGSLPSDFADDGEALYLVMGDKLLALAPRTGEERWSLPIDKLGGVPSVTPAEPFPGYANAPYPRFATPPEYSRPRAASGQFRSSFALPEYSGPNPVAARRGLLIYECGDFCIAALNTLTRKTSWAVRLPVEPFAVDAHFPVRVRPVMVGDRWLIVADEGGIYGIAMQTGQLLWRYPNGRHYDVAGIAADRSRVYYAAVMGEVGALDLETGQRLWKREPKNPLVHQPPPVPIGNLAVFVADGIIHAVNAANGSRRWDFTLPSAWELLMVPTVYGGQVFLHTGAALIALDSSGRKIWTWKTPEEDTLGNPMRVTVFKDGVLLHNSGAVVCYGMARSGQAVPARHE